MNCNKDYAKYPTSKKSTSKYVLATFTLIVTMNSRSGFGYAMGEIPAGVHLDYFLQGRKENSGTFVQEAALKFRSRS